MASRAVRQESSDHHGPEAAICTLQQVVDYLQRNVIFILWKQQAPGNRSQYELDFMHSVCMKSMFRCRGLHLQLSRRGRGYHRLADQCLPEQTNEEGPTPEDEVPSGSPTRSVHCGKDERLLLFLSIKPSKMFR